MVSKSPAHLFSLLLLMVLFSCDSKSFETKEKLWAYLQNTENGYHFLKSVNGIKYALTYKPTDLLVVQELGNKESSASVDSLRKEYEQYLYFNLSLSANGQELLNTKAGNRAEFSAMVNQFVFGMGEKAYLISKKQDTLHSLDYIYPRMYGMGNSTDILLVYEKKAKFLEHDYMRFIVEDIGFGTGQISFKLNTEKFKNQPGLAF